MKLPDLKLLHAYGNEQALLEKAADMGSLAARVAVGMLQADRSLGNVAEEDRQRAQADAMNQAFRTIQAQKMMPVRERMAHTHMPMVLMAARAARGGDMAGLGMPMQGAPPLMTGDDIPLGMDEGMVRMASAIGADLALYALDKEAGIGATLGNMGKSIGSGFSRAGGAIKNFSVGKLTGGGGGGLPSMLSKNPVAGNPLAPTSGSKGWLGTAGDKIRGALGPKPQAASSALVKPPAAPPPVPAQAASQARQKPFGQLNAPKPAQAPAAAQQGMVGGKVQSPAGQPQGLPQKPQTPQDANLHPPAAQGAAQSPSGGKTEPQPKPDAQPSAPVTPKPEGEGGFDLQKAWDRTGLSNDRWKKKLPMLAAGALGAYGLYSAAKKGFEVLGREPAPEQYNAGAAQPAYGVNEYGVPDRSAPFTT